MEMTDEPSFYEDAPSFYEDAPSSFEFEDDEEWVENILEEESELESDVEWEHGTVEETDSEEEDIEWLEGKAITTVDEQRIIHQVVGWIHAGYSREDCIEFLKSEGYSESYAVRMVDEAFSLC